jgi:GTPase SAR1 family protein
MVSRPSRVTPVVPAEPTKIKVCLVGDTEIGKTCFCRGFKDDFVTQYEPTIGSDFFMKQIKIAKGYY